VASVLFVHPYNHAVPSEIPVGSIAAVNRVGAVVLGRYAHEVEAEDLRGARVVLLDLHWFLPLAVLRGMIDAMRRVNPEARFVVGGITASFFADATRGHTGADYVVVGDADEALPTLVAHLLAGDEPPPIPNVYGSAHGPPPRRRTPRAEFDDNDFLTIGWFPSFRHHVEAAHARHRERAGHELNDNCYPILPVTRGCRRPCDFCYGAYQGDVFGPGVRLRTPGSVLRDLARVDADPALVFVTLVFADSVYFDALAGAFAGRRFDLDATLFVCGNVDPGAAATLRGAFAGRVAFSVIQPTDLAPLRLDPPRRRQEEHFAALLRRFRNMERTIVAVCHVGGPALTTVALAQAEPASNISSLEARDWSMVRPNRTLLAPDAPAAGQLASVERASRCFAALGALRTFAPDLADGVLPDHFDLGELERNLARMEPGGFEHRLVRLAIDQVVRRGLYGFDELRLGLACVDAGEGDADSVWLHPSAGRDTGERGAADWHAGLNGFGFRGEMETCGGHHCVLTAVVVVPGEPPVDLALWSAARLPAFRLPAGPRRRVAVSAEAGRGGLAIEVDDGGLRRRLFLPHPPRATVVRTEPAPTEPAPTARRRTFVGGAPFPLPACYDQDEPEAQRTLWPVRTWPRMLVQRFEHPARHGDRFALCAYEEHPTHLDLFFRRGSREVTKVSVFPRQRESRYAAAGYFNFFHWTHDGAHFDREDMRAFSRALLEVSLTARAVTARSPRDTAR